MGIIPLTWPTGRILGRFIWLCASALLTTCSEPREVAADYGQFRAKLDGQDVLVGYYKDIRWVHQSEADLCWAASLEQALGRQGVEIDQARIVEEVYPRSDRKEGRTSNLLQWEVFPVLKERFRDGSEAWIHLDIDRRDVDMYRYDFVSEVAEELTANRVPLVGISTELGQGHMVTVIGAAYPIDAKRLTTPQIVGFLIYDPLTAKPYLASIDELFGKFEVLVAVTTFDKQLEAALYCGPHCRRQGRENILKQTRENNLKQGGENILK